MVGKIYHSVAIANMFMVVGRPTNCTWENKEFVTCDGELQWHLEPQNELIEACGWITIGTLCNTMPDGVLYQANHWDATTDRCYSAEYSRSMEGIHASAAVGLQPR